jgi:hypothetical protein
MEKKCSTCEEIFTNHALYANHVRWAHKTDKKAFSEKMSKSITNFYKEVNGEKIVLETACEKCLKLFSYETKSLKPRNKRFCSRSCANSRKLSFTEDVKKRISESVSKTIKKKWENGEMKISKNFSSKEERKILEYLKDKYNEDNWTSGGGLKISDETISRDIYSINKKICIEYDGIWHFKDIHGQLETKKKKDQLLNDWCMENGWKIIRISETWWHESGKNLSSIDEFIFSESCKIFKGKEYL